MLHDDIIMLMHQGIKVCDICKERSNIRTLSKKYPRKYTCIRHLVGIQTGNITETRLCYVQKCVRKVHMYQKGRKIDSRNMRQLMYICTRRSTFTQKYYKKPIEVLLKVLLWVLLWVKSTSMHRSSTSMHERPQKYYVVNSKPTYIGFYIYIYSYTY